MSETLAQWVVRFGYESLRDANLRFGVSGTRSFELRVCGISAEDSCLRNGGKLTAQVVEYAETEIVDVAESEHLLDIIDLEDLSDPASPNMKHARCALPAWSNALTQYLARVAPYSNAMDIAQLLMHQGAFSLYFLMLKTWAHEGLPSEGLTVEVPALSDAHALAEKARLLSESETESLRNGVSAQALIGAKIGKWKLLFCPFHRKSEDTFTNDSIVVVREDGKRAEIMVNDPWGDSIMTVDGDVDLFRRFARDWCSILEHLQVDATFDLPARDESDKEPLRQTLLDWLRFDDGEVAHFPIIDHRLQSRPERISDVPFWKNEIFELQEGMQQKHAETIATHYYPFLQEVMGYKLG